MLYSKQLKKFVEQITSCISHCQQSLERNLRICLSHKDKIISRQNCRIASLKQEIDQLKAQLIAEEKILTEEA